MGACSFSPRAAAAWALARGHVADEGVRELLSRALAQEPDARAALDGRDTDLSTAERYDLWAPGPRCPLTPGMVRNL